MEYLLVGGTGFVGRHVRRAFARIGAQVVVVDRSREVSSVLSNERIVRGDVSWLVNEVPELMRDRFLVDLAWGNLDDYFSSEHLKTHLPLHRDLTSRAIELGASGILCAGTSQEYGMHEGEAFESQETDPLTPYAIAKSKLRDHVMAAVEGLGLAGAWIRIFVPYGEGQAARGLYPQLMEAATTGSVFRTSPGQQVRDFIRVEDVASIIVQLSTANHCFDVVNVCSGVPKSVNEFIAHVISENRLSTPAREIAFSAPDYEPNAIWGSRTKLKRLLTGHDGRSLPASGGEK